jgi:hypothetical protein
LKFFPLSFINIHQNASEAGYRSSSVGLFHWRLSDNVFLSRITPKPPSAKLVLKIPQKGSEWINKYFHGSKWKDSILISHRIDSKKNIRARRKVQLNIFMPQQYPFQDLGLTL